MGLLTPKMVSIDRLNFEDNSFLRSAKSDEPFWDSQIGRRNFALNSKLSSDQLWALLNGGLIFEFTAPKRECRTDQLWAILTGRLIFEPSNPQK